MKIIENTISDLDTTHKGLQESQESLQLSIKQLQATEERLSKVNRENKRQKLFTGLAGIDAGLLIGILVSN
jgi:prefoldin subunit 5